MRKVSVSAMLVLHGWGGRHQQAAPDINLARISRRADLTAEETSAVYERAGGDTLFVCAHGAGGNLSDRGVLATAKVMLARGIDVVRFNFLYKEKKSGRPDPMPKLMETITAVVERARGGEAEAGDHRWALDGGARGVDACRRWL